MKKKLGYGFMALIAMGALAFEMTESFNFWKIAFSDSQWYLGYLGFFLTSIAALGYFYDFLYVAETKTQKTVALVMTIVTAIGSVLTAGIGFQISAFEKGGFAFKKDELALMAIGVEVLVGLHMLALFIYFGGDATVKAFQDDDNDGAPNIIDPTPKPLLPAPVSPEMRQYQSAIDQLTARIAELENPTKAGEQK